MTYSEIIARNSESHCSIPWWPKFAFHYTDVTNAVSILVSETLYSRADATNLHIMQNDNASRQVIDMTNPEVVSLVRFYFRPLTPTQYYNEGYKHPSIRYDGDPNANTPVPIFFLFDLEKLLASPDVRFSEKTQAGHGTALLSGIDDFSHLNFDAIYSSGLENIAETKAYRHAEIVHSGSMTISPYLNTILCRNSVEQITLLNLLKQKNNLAYIKYRDRIKVYKKDIFENNGLFVSECLYHDHNISVSFSDSLPQRTYMRKMMEANRIESLSPINAKIEIEWFNSRSIIAHSEIKSRIDYAQPKPINITNVPSYPRAIRIGIKVYFDEKLMCYVTQSLESGEVIK